MELITITIPAGSFMMGSPLNELGRKVDEIQHEVSLTAAFRIGKYAVTFDQYDAFCEATGRTKPKDNSWGRGERPVINVTWYDADAFCKWMGGRYTIWVLKYLGHVCHVCFKSM